MGSTFFYDSISLLSTLIFLFSSSPLLHHVAAANIAGGGGGGHSSPNGGGCLNERLQRDLTTISNFRDRILCDPKTNDPLKIAASWTGDNPCNFKGFNCNMNPKYNLLTLSDVQFNGFRLGTTLDGFLDELLDVSIFHANSNNFHGMIPSNIGSDKIPFLFELDLSNNNFQGPFPTNLLQATQLTFLDLRFNNFEGTVPPQVFTLDVDVLFLNNNNFIQQLPPDLGTTPALYLTFANNKFTGPIPNSIGQAKDTLLEVLFLNNQLTGCLPWEIGLLKLARVFDVSNNFFRGTIPPSFACLDNMQILNLANNQFDGVVPEMVCALPQLKNLTLRNNYFTEVGPKCRELIEKKVLDVTGNCISDLPCQKSPEECKQFFLAHPSRRCPGQYENLPCPASRNHRRLIRRGALQVGPALSATYGALNPL